MAVFDVLSPDPSDTFEDLLERTDHQLKLTGSGPPQDVVAARTVGQRYQDTDSGAQYFCTVTDGTILGTTWIALVDLLHGITDPAYVAALSLL